MPNFSDETIIVFVLLGACGAIAMAYAMARLYSARSFETDYNAAASDEQREYLREVRRRNRAGLWMDAKRGRMESRMAARMEGGGKGKEGV